MLRQKSTVAHVRYLALLVLFLFSSNASIAQTPRTPVQPTIVTPATVVTPDETTATKTSVESPVVDEPKIEKEATPGAAPAPMQAQCKRTVKADVVPVAQPIFLNRLGAVIPGGMVFALKADTIGGLGKQLRADKRPRPIVLR